MGWRRTLLVPWLACGLVLALCVAVRAGAQQAAGRLGFTVSVSPALAAQLGQRWPSAPPALQRWQQFAVAQKSGAFLSRLDGAKGKEAEVLLAVNEFFNRGIPYRTDQQHWQQVDYWATPAESLASNGGDCEDYAIAKYYLLKELGVPISRLRITYVKAIKLNEAHMVLAYYPQPEADPLILDNLENSVRIASERTDLVPVYVFNDDEVQVMQGNLRGKPSQLRTWLNLQERLAAQAAT
jgi:predicted transglutaminase-like cysteine proteinase